MDVSHAVCLANDPSPKFWNCALLYPNRIVYNLIFLFLSPLNNFTLSTFYSYSCRAHIIMTLNSKYVWGYTKYIFY